MAVGLPNVPVLFAEQQAAIRILSDLYQQKKYREMIVQFVDFNEVAKNHSVVLGLMGQAFFHQGELVRAQQYFYRASVLDGANRDKYLLQIGNISIKNRDFAGAKRVYQHLYFYSKNGVTRSQAKRALNLIRKEEKALSVEYDFRPFVYSSDYAPNSVIRSSVLGQASLLTGRFWHQGSLAFVFEKPWTKSSEDDNQDELYNRFEIRLTETYLKWQASCLLQRAYMDHSELDQSLLLEIEGHEQWPNQINLTMGGSYERYSPLSGIRFLAEKNYASFHFFDAAHLFSAYANVKRAFGVGDFVQMNVSVKRRKGGQLLTSFWQSAVSFGLLKSFWEDYGVGLDVDVAVFNFSDAKWKDADLIFVQTLKPTLSILLSMREKLYIDVQYVNAMPMLEPHIFQEALNEAKIKWSFASVSLGMRGML